MSSYRVPLSKPQFSVSNTFKCPEAEYCWVQSWLTVTVVLQYKAFFSITPINLNSPRKINRNNLVMSIIYHPKCPLWTALTWFLKFSRIPRERPFEANIILFRGVRGAAAHRASFHFCLMLRVHVRGEHKLSSPAHSSLTAHTESLWGAATRLCISPLFVLRPTKVMMSLRAASLPAFSERAVARPMARINTRLLL